MKRILITGARSGIAAALIEQIKKEDYFIYVTVPTEKQLSVVKEFYQNDTNIECLKLDITDPIDRKEVAYLDFDVLINNAAIGMGGSMTEIPMDLVRENFEVNVFSSFELVQLAFHKFFQKKKGKIIIMGSLAGVFPLPFLGSYCGTKASIIKMTTVLAKEIKMVSSDIQVKLIEPGLYKTGFNQVMFDNKYSWMHDGTYFKEELELIRSKEHLLLHYLEKKHLDSIVRQIKRAIKEDTTKLIYRAPKLQVIGAKLYELLFQ